MLCIASSLRGTVPAFELLVASLAYSVDEIVNLYVQLEQDLDSTMYSM